MIAQGVNFRGIKYGEVSPKDYAGLRAWYRGDYQNFSFLRGVQANGWKDISGYNNHLSANTGKAFVVSNDPYYGYNISNGADAASTLLSPVNASFYKFLTDGTPFALIVVARSFRLVSQDTAAGNAYFEYRMTPDRAAFLDARVDVTGGTAASNLILHNNYWTSPNDINFRPAMALTSVPAVITMYIGYGNSGSSPRFEVYQHLNTLPTRVMDYRFNMGNPISQFQVAFSGTGAPLTFCELMMYDHSGKSRQQILSEMYQLRATYLTSRYPNIGGAPSVYPSNSFIVDPTIYNGGFLFNISTNNGYLERPIVYNFDFTVYRSDGTSTVYQNRTIAFPFGTNFTQVNFGSAMPSANCTSVNVKVNSVTPTPNGFQNVIYGSNFTKTF